MSQPQDTARRSNSRRPSAERLTCPACHAAISAGVTHCPACQFTGADSMKLFPGSPPPLLPILDVADLWNAADVKLIEQATAKVTKRFPQFQWRFCALDMPPEMELNLLGFWLLNAAALVPPETEYSRAWTILLVLNRSNGHAAVIPGYGAEPWVKDTAWVDALREMRTPWRAGESGKAVAAFLTAARKLLEREWKNSRPSGKA